MRSTEWHPGTLRPLLRKRIEGFPAVEKKAPQEPCTGECQETRIRARRGTESCHDLCLLAINNPHDGQLA
jgi:hypothetical protein